MPTNTDTIGSDRGITRTLSGFVLESEDITDSDVAEVIPNQVGACVGEKSYDTRYDLTLTGRLAGGSAPSSGDIISYGGKSWKVDTVKEAGVYNGLRRYTITAHCGANWTPSAS